MSVGVPSRMDRLNPLLRGLTMGGCLWGEVTGANSTLACCCSLAGVLPGGAAPSLRRFRGVPGGLTVPGTSRLRVMRMRSALSIFVESSG